MVSDCSASIEHIQPIDSPFSKSQTDHRGIPGHPESIEATIEERNSNRNTESLDDIGVGTEQMRTAGSL